MKQEEVNQLVIQIATRCDTALSIVSELIDLSSVVATLPPCISDISDSHSLDIEEHLENVRDDARQLIRYYDDTRPNGLLYDDVPMLNLDAHGFFIHIQHQAARAMGEAENVKTDIRSIDYHFIPEFAREQAKLIISKWKAVYIETKRILSMSDIIFDDVNTTLGYTAITRLA